MQSRGNTRSSTYLLAFVAITLVLMLNVALDGQSGRGVMLASAEKKTDILFLKGKFIMKNKKGSIVIADEKKCHCPHYYR